MQFDRRSFLQTAAAASALTATGFAGRAFAADGDIKLASIHDLSGIFDLYGKPMDQAVILALEEINAGGGLLGQTVDIVSYDTQSQIPLYTQYGQQAALKDKVAVVHGGIDRKSVV